jgi:hypothetical protein
MSAFLTQDDVATLTGRKVKSMQIEALKKMRLPFFVNACGRPIVTVSAIEGRREAPQPKTWSPAL